MNLGPALAIEGFTNSLELHWLAQQVSTRLKIAEIGSWQGRSTRALADNMPGNATLYAIDTWNGTAGEHEKWLQEQHSDWLYTTFKENLREHLAANSVAAIRNSSLDGAHDAKRLGLSFDMIFIDAAHDYHSVRADIRAWRPLLAPGGLFCGHDFDGGRPGVVKAVRECVPSVRMANAGSIWYEA